VLRDDSITVFIFWVNHKESFWLYALSH